MTDDAPNDPEKPLAPDAETDNAPEVLTELFTDPGKATSDVKLVEQAIRGAWNIPDKLLDALPGLVTKIAIKGKGEREKLRAVETLLKMRAQNYQLLADRLGTALGSPSVNVQTNVAVMGTQGDDQQPPWIVRGREPVALFFRRTVETIKSWVSKGMPCIRGGPGEAALYDLCEIMHWRDENVVDSGRNDTGDVSRLEADRRKAVAEAEKRELETAKMRGELIEVDAVARDFRHHATHGRALWEQAPDQLLGLLPASATGEDKRRFRREAVRIVDSVIAAMFGELGGEATT